jgi:hypothetical protein
MTKDLKSKAIDIKGKKYVLVSDRVIFFNDNYPDGCINTELISDPESDQVIIKAVITPDTANNSFRTFTGYSQAIKGDGMVNKTAALENAETSAVGRALGMMGIGVLDSIASADEIVKAKSSTGQRTSKLATPKQVEWIRNTAHELNDQLRGVEETDDWIESILTIKPEQVPIFKVKDAVDKLKSSQKEDIVIPDLSDEDVEKALENFEKGVY